MATPSRTLFEAVIVPHRSLSPRGLRILVGFICGVSALALLRFWLIRAWPVMGFSVVEICLAVGLLRLNARRARACELVLLSAEALRVVRTDPSGRREEILLAPAWLNVVLEEAPGQVPRLLLVARDVREEIARVLGEEEKRSMASALRQALYNMRHPEFDNPQLRESDRRPEQ